MPVGQIVDKTHPKKVEAIKKVLTNLNLPILPLNTIRCKFYTTDVVTRIKEKFIPIEFINTESQLNFDIGGLCMIYDKDIIEICLAVVDNKLWDDNLHDFRKAKGAKPQQG